MRPHNIASRSLIFMLTALLNMCSGIIPHPACADQEPPIVLGPPIHIGGNPVYDVATGCNYSPAMAFDGTNYLVVWQRWRQSHTDVCASRVTPSGIALDTLAISVTADERTQSGPAVAFNGETYLVVWAEEVSNSSSFEIRGARVTSSGDVLDPEGIVISALGNKYERPRISTDGTNFFVVWAAGQAGPQDVYGAIISREGELLDPEPTNLTNSVRSEEFPDLAFDGTNYLVVWDYMVEDRNDIAGTRVNADGVVLDPDGISISTEMEVQMQTAVAFDGTNYLVVWEDWRRGEIWDTADIYAARVSTAGDVLDPDGILVASESEVYDSISAAFDGRNYAIAWADRGMVPDINVVRVSPSGAVLDQIPIGVSSDTSVQSSAQIGFDGTNYFVLWSDYKQYFCASIFGARMTPSGTVMEPGGALYLWGQITSMNQA